MTALPDPPHALPTEPPPPPPPRTEAPPFDETTVDPTDGESAAADDGPIAARVRAFVLKLASYVGDLPEWFTCPPGIIDIWKYAREAPWTTAKPNAGFLRTLATIWAAIAISIACPAYILVWSAGRPLRFIFCYAATLLIGSMVAQVPILGYLVPPIYNLAALF